MFYFQKFFYYYEEKFNTKFGYFNLLFMVIIEKIIKHLLSFYSLFYHLMMKLVGRGFFINLNKKFCFPSYILIFISNDTCNIFYRRKHSLDSSFHFRRIYLHRLGYSCSRSSGRKTCVVNIIFLLFIIYIFFSFIHQY